MSDVDKMYEAPDKLGNIQSPVEGTTGVTADTRIFIGQAAPWLQFLGVMGFIGCGFLVLGGIIMLIIPTALSSMPGVSSAFTAGMGLFIGAVYLGFAVVTFFPALFLFKMGTASTSYKLQGQAPVLQELASNLKKWAKFNGIVIIVAISLFVLAFIGAIIFGISAATRAL
jgi:hypothetical protein